MPIVKFTGDLNSKFGNNLPTPFIERVVIRDKFITVTTAVYFNIDEFANNNFEDYINKLDNSGLRIYYAFIMDRETDPIYDDIVAGEKTVLSAATKGISSEILGWPNGNLPVNILFSHLLTADDTNFITKGSNKIGRIAVNTKTEIETFYDENNKPVKKLTFSKDIFISDSTTNTRRLLISPQVSGWAGPTAFNTTYANLIEFAEASAEKIKNFGIFAFSTNIELPLEQLTESDPADIEFYGSLISPCGYITIVEDGFVKTSEDVIYTDEQKEIVEDAMLTIGGAYHKVGETTQRSIADSFNRLANEDTAFQKVRDAQDNLKFLISRFSKKVDFMTELNEYRKSFIDKSSVTPLGNFYNSFKNELTRNNNVIKVGENVAKELVANPRIIDDRESRTIVGTPTFNQVVRTKDYADGSMTAIDGQNGVAWDPFYAFIYPGATRMDRRVFVDEDKMYFVDAGNFFFDYEKALYRYSKLSQLVDLRKIASFFGASLINLFFKVTKARVYYSARVGVPRRTGGTHSGRYVGEDFIDLFVINANINDFSINNFSAINSDYSDINEYEHLLENGRLSTSSGDLHNYLALRSFEAAYPGGLDNSDGEFYKLMSFEFQRINSADYVETIAEESSDSDIEKIELIEEIYSERRTFYDFEVRVADTTLELYDSIINQLLGVKDIYDGYVTLVNQECAFNNTEGYFNDFFVDGILRQYADNMEEAPWIRATLLYEFHRDLLFDEHDGDLNLIYEAASKQSELIAPETGTLEQVEEFKENLDALYEEYYNKDSNSAEPNSPADRFSEVFFDLSDEIIFGSPISGTDETPWRQFGQIGYVTSRYLYEDLPDYVSDGAFDIDEYMSDLMDEFTISREVTLEKLIMKAITEDVAIGDFGKIELGRYFEIMDANTYTFGQGEQNDPAIWTYSAIQQITVNNTDTNMQPGTLAENITPEVKFKPNKYDVILELYNEEFGTDYRLQGNTGQKYGGLFFVNREMLPDGTYTKYFVDGYNAWALTNSKDNMRSLFENVKSNISVREDRANAIRSALQRFGDDLKTDDAIDDLTNGLWAATTAYIAQDNNYTIGGDESLFKAQIGYFFDALFEEYQEIAVRNFRDGESNWITGE